MKICNMENKYYTPSIEEFYVGFEFEELVHYFDYSKQEAVDEWRPQVLQFEDLIYGIEVIKEPKRNIPNSLRNFNYEVYKFPYDEKRKEQYYPYRSAIRVKHLDKEDIESLGFVLYESGVLDERMAQMYYYFISESGYKIKLKCNEVQILLNSYGTLFQGKIKNINELKKILTMVGVLC